MRLKLIGGVLMRKLTITKSDKYTYLIECDDLISQPFHESDYKDMILFINHHIKKLEHIDIFKAIEAYKGPLPTKGSGKLKQHPVNQHPLFK